MGVIGNTPYFYDSSIKVTQGIGNVGTQKPNIWLDFTPTYGSRDTAHAQHQHWRDLLAYSQKCRYLILLVSQKLQNQS